MGCGGSKDADGGKKGGGGRKVEVVPYDRRPKLSVRVGPQVQKLDDGDSGHRLVFIFGGPGSRKGRIVDDLINSYGFQFLCGEDIIFQELPKKVSNIMKLETVKDIKNLLEEDPSHITLEWMLQCIERRVEQFRDSGKTFLVDIIPNLRYLLRIEGLTQNDFASLEQFEEKYPVSFGLNLAIPVDKVLDAKNYCSTPDKNGTKMKESGGQSDEADSSRTQKRAAIYDQCAQPFLNYFAKTERLVTVDVTCGVADLIWHRVHETLLDLDFHPGRVVNTVVLFGWSDNDISEINIEKYVMERVDLRNIVENPSDDMEKLLVQLSQHINNQSQKADSFVVSLEGTSVTQNKVMHQVASRPITFLEVEEGYLETYLPGSPKNCTPQPGSRRLKAICTLENEVYLFPPDTDVKAACNVATRLADTRHI